MSCFNGQMKEYNHVAIDRFDGKNLQCTAFFLSHCHKDHMVGLNSSSFAHSLYTRSGIFLYCSEITRLLLLAEEDYHHLQKYIRVLKVGMPQPVSVPSNSTSVADYYVNVTLISAGHCPGSVMFLFEGHEGICLYTGDFRWEVNHAAGVAVFKEENRLKHIKSIYVDTTFCIPEAFHIPSRSECIDAAVTLVADWLQRSALNVVFMSCPARYGYEHLLMELSVKLNMKVHVPEWKTKIYDKISDLKNVFTSDPTQTRIHACSAKMSCTSSLPCYRSSESKHVSVLNLRPSAMWFTSEKSTAKREDLVPPESPKGLYRICYSLHSSYSEIRDLVSYLQPGNAFPNVQPVSDVSIEVVQTRLHSFQKHVNSARVQMSVGKIPFQPLGTLRKIVSAYTTMQKQQNRQDAESSNELVFSSQEADSKKGLLRSITGSSSLSSSLSRAGKLEGNNNFSPAECEGSSADGALSSSASNAHSSYKGSLVSDKEMFSNSGETCRQAILHLSNGDCDDEDGDIVFSSQVSPRTELIQNHVLATISDNTSAVSDQEENDHEAAANNITNNYTSLKTVDPQIAEAVTVLSSSEDSLNTLEQESQTLWSVSYNLDHFAHGSYLSHQETDTEISFGNFSKKTGKENSSLKQREGTTLHTTEQQQSPCFNQGNAQFTVNRNAKQLKSHPALKRKYISNIIDHERSLKGIKRFTNDTTCDSVTEITNQCNVSGKRATGLKNSFSRLKESSLSKYKVTGSERNICRVENTQPVSSDCRQDHMQNSDYCRHRSAGDVSVQSVQTFVQTFEKSDWIDLTKESPIEVVDLTLEDSP